MHSYNMRVVRFYKQLACAICAILLCVLSSSSFSSQLPIWLFQSNEPLSVLADKLDEKLITQRKLPANNTDTLRIKANQSYWMVIDLHQLPHAQTYVAYLAEPNLMWKKFYILDSASTAKNDARLIPLPSLSNVRPHWLIEHRSENRWALVNFQHDRDINLQLGVVNSERFEINLHKTILSYGAIIGVLLICIFVCLVYYAVSKRVKYLFLSTYFALVGMSFLIDNGLSGYLVSGLGWSTKWPFYEFSLGFVSYFLYEFLNIKNSRSGLNQTWLVAIVMFFAIALMTSFLPAFNLSWVYIVSCSCFIVLSVTTAVILNKQKNHPSLLRQCMLIILSCQFASLLIWNGFGFGKHVIQDIVLLIGSLAICTVLLLKDRHRIASFNYSLTHDADTQLPNKQLLLDEMVKKVSQKQHFAIMLFRPHVLTNARATFGYDHANQCINTTLNALTQQLQSINALKLETRSEQGVWIARIDDSIFACVILGELELSHIEQFACVIHGVFEEGISHNNIKLVDSVDIGVAYYPMHGNTAKQILQCAIQAMSEKQVQGERWRMFDLENARLSEQRLLIAASLKSAIEEDQLALYFQPQVCLKTGNVVGCEALLRWQHPALGAISPEVFIPIAESSGVINQLTEWVVTRGIEWQAIFTKHIPNHVISINISAKDLLNKDLPVLFITKLNEQGVEPSSVMLELTESATLEESKKIKVLLNDYRLIGVKLAIDDFGTGYSSLAYLSQLGFDEVKIDKQFVLNLQFSNNDKSICKATCDIATTLGAEVVAEGIEDEQSLAILKSYGCQVGQGYYFAKPMSADDYVSWIQNFKSIDISLDVKAHLVD
ncbi:EAL domain-containing protein [Pseudoalteromonas sp. L21]|uniref:EAL domain-containing protein n=1 Tax=Pseudoalteromonas sp. L21 TaxID=1539746 RepID=UPI001F2C9E41|nr:EAL domain-containing protein [Pseudoalteromonas sp. L21]MCF7519311.1 EAL domain-containing protein [Pseudoalteromonas sp. L21]